MKNLNGWQFVILVGMILGTLLGLMAMGQELAAVVGAGIAIATALGANVVQNVSATTTQREQLGQVKDLANGNLDALRIQISSERAQHALERAELNRQLQTANDRAIQLAALIPPTEVGLPNGQ